ncbi:hypothetical protein QJS66_20145 [Kocuria rhizophila]|nr:hypothetical protein QJS66_20145 [Kocuria rhizophila]
MKSLDAHLPSPVARPALLVVPGLIGGYGIAASPARARRRRGPRGVRRRGGPHVARAAGPSTATSLGTLYGGASARLPAGRRRWCVAPVLTGPVNAAASWCSWTSELGPTPPSPFPARCTARDPPTPR